MQNNSKPNNGKGLQGGPPPAPLEHGQENPNAPVIIVEKAQQPGPTQSAENHFGTILKTFGYKRIFVFFPGNNRTEVDMPFTPAKGERVKFEQSVYKVDHVTHDVEFQETRIHLTRTF